MCELKDTPSLHDTMVATDADKVAAATELSNHNEHSIEYISSLVSIEHGHHVYFDRDADMIGRCDLPSAVDEITAAGIQGMQGLSGTRCFEALQAPTAPC